MERISIMHSSSYAPQVAAYPDTSTAISAENCTIFCSCGVVMGAPVNYQMSDSPLSLEVGKTF